MIGAFWGPDSLTEPPPLGEDFPTGGKKVAMKFGPNSVWPVLQEKDHVSYEKKNNVFFRPMFFLNKFL